jgi:hypothetical protein
MTTTLQIKPSELTDEHSLVSATNQWGRELPIYDDGFGKLYIHRDSMGISGIVRAQSWEDAYSICEDEFFPEASETVPELMRDYGFRREHKKVIKCDEFIPEASRPYHLGPYEKFADESDYTAKGKLPEGKFIRWITICHPDNEAWMDNELFQEAYGFRPNGRRSMENGVDRDPIGHGIYSKDINGDYLDVLTDALAQDLEITLVASIEVEEETPTQFHHWHLRRHPIPGTRLFFASDSGIYGASKFPGCRHAFLNNRRIPAHSIY